MAFHKSDPSRVWKFGCHPPKDERESGPIERQFSLAHRYYNNLVELERDRRAKIDDLVREHSPTLVSLEQSIETILAELQEQRRLISERNQSQRRRTSTSEERAEIEELTARLSEARKAVKQERERLWGNPIKREPGEKPPRRRPGEPIKIKREGGNRVFLNKVESIENAALRRQQQLRGGCGLYWGTYLLTEKAWNQACQDAIPGLPHFRRWNGDGIIGVQLQGGLSAKDAFSGTDPKLRLIMEEGHRSQRGQNGQAWLRIGSEGRKPIWAIFGFRLDRPLPKDALVKWAVVSRRRYGFHQTPPYDPIYRYYLHLTFSSAQGFERTDRAATGRVAVNAGWRYLPDGSLRVATWLDDNGRYEFVKISVKDISRWKKADELRSIRDSLYNEILARLGTWLETNEGIVPDWLSSACSHLYQWKNQGRLAALIGVGRPREPREGEQPQVRWCDNRFGGDDEMFSLLEGWLQQTNHLWRWEANQRRKAIAWRDKMYENLAACLRRKYRELRIGDIDQRKLALRANPEDTKEAIQLVRFHRFIASPGRIGELLKNSFEKENRTVVPSRLLTQKCPFCGNEERWDAAPDIMHTCTKCGERYDQDWAHCKNLLDYEPPASGGEADETLATARIAEAEEGYMDRNAEGGEE